MSDARPPQRAASEAHVYRSFAEADAADRAWYRSLTGEERVDLLLDLVARFQEASGEASSRLERVGQVVRRAPR